MRRILGQVAAAAALAVPATPSYAGELCDAIREAVALAPGGFTGLRASLVDSSTVGVATYASSRRLPGASECDIAILSYSTPSTFIYTCSWKLGAAPSAAFRKLHASLAGEVQLCFPESRRRRIGSGYSFPLASGSDVNLTSFPKQGHVSVIVAYPSEQTRRR